MRINILFKSENPIVLPTQYNHIIQAMILKWINEENYSKFIHDHGYEYNGRKYKMYTFSRLEGRYSINRIDKTITYTEGVNLTISSMDNRFLSYIVDSILKEGKAELWKNKVSIEEVKCFDEEVEEKMKVFTKSPIVTYSTFMRDDRKKTYYYNPFEDEFNELIRLNLIKKYKAIFGKDPLEDTFEIKPANRERLKESIVIYKNTVIKAWGGEFYIKGSKELNSIAYNSGIGSKNSQGFGCIEIKK